MANERLGHTAAQRAFGEGGVPVGEWAESAIEWCAVHMGWVFDAIAWPFERLNGLLAHSENGLLGLPLPIIVIGLSLLGLVGGGWKRAAFVLVSLGLLSVLGTDVWAESMDTLAALVVVLLMVAPCAIAVAALSRRRGEWSRGLVVLSFGPSWIHPFGVAVAGIFLFGTGGTTALVLTSLVTLPVVLAEAAQPTGRLPLEPDVDTAWSESIPGRTLSSLQAAVQPALFVLIFYSFLGMGGLSVRLLRTLTNQNLAGGTEAGLAIALVGFATYNLLGSWSSSPLRERLDNRAIEDETLTDVAAETVETSAAV